MKIDMTHKVDYTKIPLIGVSTSCYYYAKNQVTGDVRKFENKNDALRFAGIKDPSTEHYLLTNIGSSSNTWSTTYSVEVKDEYISIKAYRVTNASRCADFQKAFCIRSEEEKFPSYGNRYIYEHEEPHVEDGETVTRDQVPDIEREYRIYKDKTMAILIRLGFPTKDRYFVYTKEYLDAYKKGGYYYDLGSPFRQYEDRAMRSHPFLLDNTYVDADESEIVGTVAEMYTRDDVDRSIVKAKEIFDEQEVYDSRFNITATRNIAKHEFGDFIQAGIILDNGNVHTNKIDMAPNFLTNLTEEIEKFFGRESEPSSIAEEHVRRIKKEGRYWGITEELKYFKLDNLYKLAMYLPCKGKLMSTVKDKEADAKKYMDMFKWDEMEHKGNTWIRTPEEIILGYKEDHSSESGFSKEHNVFVYNIAKRTKKLITNKIWSSTYHKGKWTLSTKIPSRDTIQEEINLNDEISWDWRRGKREITRQLPQAKIIGASSIEELFKDTNIEYLINWIKSDTKNDFKIVNERENNKIKSMYSLREMLSEGEIYSPLLSILVASNPKTTGVVEQLIKSNNIHILERYIEGYERRSLDIFGRTYDNKIELNTKATSLKKMFSMTLEQISYINELAEIDEDKKDSFPCIQLSKIQKVFGIKDFSAMDIKTFKELCKCQSGQDRGGNIVDTIYTLINDGYWKNEEFKKFFERLKLQQKVEFCLRYSSCQEEFRDYQNMRSKLKEIQDKIPDQEIFKDIWYPVKPGKSKKFIYYRPEQRYKVSYWDERFLTPSEFKEHINNKYRKYGNVEFVMDDSKLAGAYIDMEYTGTLVYLHDELTTLVEIYEDEARAAGFNEAIKRVQPFEYEDSETGLSIISPKTIGDIKTEGSVLSHCVGSYVDSIAQGAENIMFIRRTDMKYSPYYTLELIKEKDEYIIRQVHCYANGDLTPEGQEEAYARSKYEVYNKKFDIVKFLNNWSKKFKKIDNRSIKAKYGALCHL